MRKLSALLVLVLASVALVACGGSDDTTGTSTTSSGGGEAAGAGAAAETGAKEAQSGGGSSTLAIEAAPGSELAFTSDTAEAEAGKVEVDFKNPQQLGHDVAIEDSSGKELGATDVISDSEATTTVDLKPGTYTFFCTVPGHREAGMEGTLTVK